MSREHADYTRSQAARNQVLVQRLDAQGGRCALCGEEIAVGGRAVLDHDHATGWARSALCKSCNLRLGNAEKGRRPATAPEAAYLDRWGKEAEDYAQPTDTSQVSRFTTPPERAEAARRLRGRRERMGLSQAGLGRLLSVSGKTVYCWEERINPIPRLAELAIEQLEAERGLDDAYVDKAARDRDRERLRAAMRA